MGPFQVQRTLSLAAPGEGQALAGLTWETYLAVAVRILLKLQAPLGRSAWPTGVSVRGPKPACPRAATWEAQ